LKETFEVEHQVKILSRPNICDTCEEC
jgi:hypothetical protein